jgi:hypothetical protein
MDELVHFAGYQVRQEWLFRTLTLSAQIETLDRLCLSRRARTFPLPEFYNVTIRLIPTAADVAL